jgi:hypothetical protein
VFPGGIPGGEAFGTFQINQQVVMVGVPGAEAFGLFQLNQQILPDGIPGAEAFGVFNIYNMWQFIFPVSIPGGEAFGVFTVAYASTPGQHTQFETDIEQVFLTNNADFAESVEVHYDNDDYTTHSLMAIFDNEYIGADVDSEFVVQMRQPMLIVQTRKLRRKLKRGDWFKVRGVTYQVITSEPDGTGVSEITLKHKV